jgi:tetratricopeptide (TPR) repeat protein
MNYKRAFELSMNETTYLRLGKFYLSLGRYEDAVTIYKKALNQ